MVSDIECKAIRELDLEPIKAKLTDKESGEGWTRERACAAEAEYRRFWSLIKMFPKEAVAPLEDVDTFWHHHILDTMKYARDCDLVFGYFLHHLPDAGLRGDDFADHERLGERTRNLYEKTFGRKYGAGLLEDNASLAGPRKPAGVAFCAAPGSQAIAFCAAPGSQAIAFCAAPGSQAIAFCAAPGSQAIAFCAAPAQPAGSPAVAGAGLMHEFLTTRLQLKTHAIA